MIRRGCKKYLRLGDNIPNVIRRAPLMDCEREIPVAARRVVRRAVREKPVSCLSLDRGDCGVSLLEPALGDTEL